MPASIYAANINSQPETLQITATVIDPNATPTLSQSGSGQLKNASIIISGFAAPGSIVTLLIDGSVQTVLNPNSNGSFQINLQNVKFGNYQIALVMKDPSGTISAPVSIFVQVNQVRTYLYENIILPPTINQYPQSIGSGQTFSVTGYAPPNSSISAWVDGIKYEAIASANSQGFYSLSLQSPSLPEGSAFVVRTASKLNGKTSNYSAPARIVISGRQFGGDNSGGNGNGSGIGSGNTSIGGGSNSNGSGQQSGASQQPVLPAARICSDFSRDGRINLVDFSILLYWLGKKGFPPASDCNSDSVIDIKDFSLLMYYWTG